MSPLAIFLIVAGTFIALERVFLYVVMKRRGRRLSFSEFYILAAYKPLLIVLAIGVYLMATEPDLLGLLILVVIGSGTIAISYPLARALYPRHLAAQDPSDDPTSH